MWPDNYERDYPDTSEQDLPPGASLDAQIAEWRMYKEYNDTRGFTEFDIWMLGQMRIRL